MSDTPTGTLPDDTAIGRVDLGVAELEPVAVWYRSVVGLTHGGKDDGVVEFTAGDATLVRLIERPTRPPRGRADAGLFHLAVRVPDRSTLADAARRLAAANDLTGASDHGVSEALYATDPAGNGVELYRDRPRSDWPRAADGSIEMTTEALDVAGLIDSEATGDDSLPPVTDIGHIHLEVTDLGVSTAFYEDTLGLEEQDCRRGARFLAAGGYHHHLGLNTWRERTEPAGGLGLERFAITLPTEADVAAVTDRLERAGHAIDREANAVLVDDPDGIGIRLHHP